MLFGTYSDPSPPAPSSWRVTIEAAPPAGTDRRLSGERLPLLIQAIRRHDAAGLIAGGSSCGAKLTVVAPDVEAALDAGLRAWRAAARDAGLVQWCLVRCEAVHNPRKQRQSEHHDESQGRERLA